MDSFYTEVLLFLSSFYFPPLVMMDGNSVSSHKGFNMSKEQKAPQITTNTGTF